MYVIVISTNTCEPVVTNAANVKETTKHFATVLKRTEYHYALMIFKSLAIHKFEGKAFGRQCCG